MPTAPINFTLRVRVDEDGTASVMGIKPMTTSLCLRGRHQAAANALLALAAEIESATDGLDAPEGN